MRARHLARLRLLRGNVAKSLRLVRLAGIPYLVEEEQAEVQKERNWVRRLALQY